MFSLTKFAAQSCRRTGAARVLSFQATPPRLFPLHEFRDTIARETRMSDRVGRSWSVTELRRKSFEDLHKLWLVLYKERNMLLTEHQLSRRKGIIFPQPERITKVRKSMGAIRQVLGERKRSKLAALALRQMDEREE